MSAVQRVSFSARTPRRSLGGPGTGVPSMTSDPKSPKQRSEHAEAPPVTEPSDAPRLQLKPGPPAAAHLDGAWWPRSRALTTEVPPLLDELHDRVGSVALVGYHSNAWEPVPAELNVRGRSVRFQGFTSDNPHTLIVVGTDSRRVALLVVPPDTTGVAADRALSDASRPPAADEGEPDDATARSLDDVATRLAERTGTPARHRLRQSLSGFGRPASSSPRPRSRGLCRSWSNTSCATRSQHSTTSRPQTRRRKPRPNPGPAGRQRSRTTSHLIVESQ